MSSIAFITNFFPSLSETFIYNEVSGLRSRGLSIKTYSIRKPEIANLSKESYDLFYSTIYLLPLNVIEFFKAHCYYFTKNTYKYLKILYLLLTRHFNKKNKDRIRTFFHFCEGVYLAKIVRKEYDISHIHAHYASHPSTLAMIVSFLTEIPFSLTAHADDIVLDKLFIAEKVNASKFVITCTKYGKEAILQNPGINNIEKISVIYHGVNINKYSKSIVKKSTKIHLLNVGRLSEEKAQKNLIKACKILKEEGYEFQCQIVGGGPLFAELYEEIKINHLKSSVKLIGQVFQEEIREYYKKADIFVLPSIRENLPNVLLECMAMGVPAIASNIAGIPELIKNGINGILVQPNDINALVDAIKILLIDEELRLFLGDNSRKSVCEEFDFEKSIDRIENLYHKYHVI